MDGKSLKYPVTSVFITRSYYRKWSAALQYLTRLTFELIYGWRNANTQTNKQTNKQTDKRKI